LNKLGKPYSLAFSLPFEDGSPTSSKHEKSTLQAKLDKRNSWSMI